MHIANLSIYLYEIQIDSDQFISKKTFSSSLPLLLIVCIITRLILIQQYGQIVRAESSAESNILCLLHNHFYA